MPRLYRFRRLPAGSNSRESPSPRDRSRTRLPDAVPVSSCPRRRGRGFHFAEQVRVDADLRAVVEGIKLFLQTIDYNFQAAHLAIDVALAELGGVFRLRALIAFDDLAVLGAGATEQRHQRLGFAKFENRPLHRLIDRVEGHLQLNDPGHQRIAFPIEQFQVRPVGPRRQAVVAFEVAIELRQPPRQPGLELQRPRQTDLHLLGHLSHPRITKKVTKKVGTRRQQERFARKVKKLCRLSRSEGGQTGSLGNRCVLAYTLEALLSPRLACAHFREAYRGSGNSDSGDWLHSALGTALGFAHARHSASIQAPTKPPADNKNNNLFFEPLGAG